MGAARALDPITVEVIGNHLLAIAEEMEVILVKSSYSTNIKERRDCSTAIIDAEGDVIAQGQHNPMHLGAVAGIVHEILRRHRPETIRPGDVFVANDPYLGGNTHLPDVAVAAPFFDFSSSPESVEARDPLFRHPVNGAGGMYALCHRECG